MLVQLDSASQSLSSSPLSSSLSSDAVVTSPSQSIGNNNNNNDNNTNKLAQSSPNSVIDGSTVLVPSLNILSSIDDDNDSAGTDNNNNNINNDNEYCIKNLSNTMEKIANEIESTKNNSTINCFNPDDKLYPLREIRNQMFRLTAAVGNLAMKFLDDNAESLDESNDDDSNIVNVSFNDNLDDIAAGFGGLLKQLLHLTHLLDINLYVAVTEKMELNRRKYPADLCKGKSGKYTEYTNVTGISKEKGQDIINTPNGNIYYQGGRMTFDSFIGTLPSLNLLLRQFAIAREWQQYHTPRNVLLALTGELGELIELVQWKGDDITCTLSTKELDQLAQEIADVTIYLVRLADVCNIDVQNVVVA